MNSTKQAKVLIALCLTDSIMGNWLRVWWIKIFSDMISSNMLSINGILQSLLGLLTLSFVVKKCEIPKMRTLILNCLFSYTGLFALLISPSVFILVSTVLGSLFGSLATAFNNAIYAQNISQEYRNKFDVTL
jgi:hypothetical protein